MFNKADNTHSMAESNTIVGQGTTFDGNVESADNLRIEGKLSALLNIGYLNFF